MMVIDASVWVAAYMAIDVHYAVSKQFLRRAIAQGVQFAAPVLLPIEVAAAVTRGAGQPERAKRLVRMMLKLPALRLHPLDGALAVRSVRMAVAVQLRGADAVYAALAEALGVPLISWDNEHLTRASRRITVYTPLTVP
jgi:predicted nucleic acid-binding protein